MTTLKLYESWGMLGKEKTPVYSVTTPATENYNVITVEMPFPLSENAAGQILVDIDGTTWLLNEVLDARRDAPCVRWYDGQHTHRTPLTIVS